MTSALLCLRDLEIFTSSRSRPVVCHKTLDIAASEIVGLTGPSGVGKTLTALAVMRLLPRQFSVTRGQILFNGIDLVRAGERQLNTIRGQQLSMLFQEPQSALNPNVTCGVQLIDPLRFHDVFSAKEREKLAQSTLNSMGINDSGRVMRSFPRELSGGEQQRVLAAMAMVMKPTVLIADEPTTSLDPILRLEFVNLLKKLRDDFGTAILCISHDIGVLEAVSDRVLLMEAGTVVQERKPRSMKRRAAKPHVVVPSSTGQTIVLQVANLKKTFKSKTGKASVSALNDVSFQILRSESVGIIGRSASGKTTLARCICNLTKADRGLIQINGGSAGGDAATNQKPQLIFQNSYLSLDPLMTARESIAEALEATQRNEIDKRVAELLDLVGLSNDYRARFPRELSAGQRQRVAIARALASQARLLVADEPTSSLDSHAAEKLIELLQDLKQKRDVAYLIMSHDIRFLEAICDRIVVLERGTIIEDGPTSEILSQPLHPETQRLIEASLRLQ